MAAGCWLKLELLGVLVVVSSSLAAIPDRDSEYLLDENTLAPVDDSEDEKPDLDISPFQDGRYGGLQMPPDGDLQQEVRESNMASEWADDMARKEILRNLRIRFAVEKIKRSMFGNVLSGYKLGKRDFMPYEYMNDYQRSVLGGILNYGKRVPEELPANYVTGGQIYDSNTEEARGRRAFGDVLNSYKLGKRNPRWNNYRRLMNSGLYQYPTYRMPGNSLRL